VLWNICKGNNNFNELFVLASKGNNEIIRNKFERLKEYREEVLIYPLDDYLQKSKLKASEY
jgi:molecular chaperone DnaK (HSP70)